MSQRSTPVPSESIKMGRNFDKGALDDGRWVKCWNCAHTCHLDRDSRSRRGSHAGDGITQASTALSDVVKIDDTTINVDSVTGFRTPATSTITAFASAGGRLGRTTVTSAAHGVTGDKVIITGTTSYNGTWNVHNVFTDTFEIQTPFVADDATGTITVPEYIVIHNDGTAASTDWWRQNSIHPLLIEFDGADEAVAYTAETGQTVTFGGTAQLDTAQKDSGDSSLLLDGNSDYVTVPDSVDWNFGSGDFTIDVRVRAAALPTSGAFTIIGQFVSATSYWNLNLQFVAGPTYRWDFVASNVKEIFTFFSTSTIVVDTWYRVEVTRRGKVFKMYVDGTEILNDVGSKAYGVIPVFSGYMPDVASNLYIGSRADGAYCVNGWIDHVRIAKGTATDETSDDRILYTGLGSASFTGCDNIGRNHGVDETVRGELTVTGGCPFCGTLIYDD